jgi:2-phosphosulfolactate phosphatase
MGRQSPEAEIAVAVFEQLRGDLAGSVAACTSGKELAERGFHCDVELAAGYSVGRAVPMLAGDRFFDVSSSTGDSWQSSATPRLDPA